MKLAALVFCLLFANLSYAWGPTGHRAVGAIATKYLKKRTLKKIT
ncbi:MAG: S1/P1 Nuclease, partial [Halobacteriovoraceae bacterium]|nr:S1/P1 Nuclease [Halobacteriovoraceae bacterium]